MLKSHRNLALLAALLFVVSFASACNEKAPTEGNYCEETGNCEGAN